jgi:hypothetical protein
MTNICLSDLALKKIVKERDNQIKFLGHIVIPLLAYYQRSYLTKDDGTIIEYGAGFALQFPKPDEINKDSTVIIEVDDYLTFAIQPSSKFRDGTHNIDYVDWKIVLKDYD